MTTPRYTLHLAEHIIPVKLANHHRCGGVKDGFRCSFTVTADRLDPDGYIVEVHDLLEAIKQRFARHPVKASCEELAAGVVNSVLLLVPYAVHCSAIVHNLVGHVSVEWSYGSDTPAFPRIARKDELS